MRPVSSNSSKPNLMAILFNDGLSTYGLPGDSGSPLFVYDTKDKRWELAGTLLNIMVRAILAIIYCCTRPVYGECR